MVTGWCRHVATYAWDGATVTNSNPHISEDIGKALTATVLENLRNVDFEDDEVIANDDNWRKVNTELETLLKLEPIDQKIES